VAGSTVEPAVGHELGKIDEIAVGLRVGITVGSSVRDELGEIDGTTDWSIRLGPAVGHKLVRPAVGNKLVRPDVKDG